MMFNRRCNNETLDTDMKAQILAVVAAKEANRTSMQHSACCTAARRSGALTLLPWLRRQHEEHLLADDPGQPLRGQHQRSHAEVGVLLHAGRGLGQPLRALRDGSVSRTALGHRHRAHTLTKRRRLSRFLRHQLLPGLRSHEGARLRR